MIEADDRLPTDCNERHERAERLFGKIERAFESLENLGTAAVAIQWRICARSIFGLARNDPLAQDMLVDEVGKLRRQHDLESAVDDFQAEIPSVCRKDQRIESR